MDALKVKYVGNIEELPPINISNFIKGGTKRIVFGPERFWEDHVMRCFTLEPGAVAPENQHSWLHWAICLSGEGKFVVGDYEYSINQGSWMHVPSNIKHTFWNTSRTESLVIICIVKLEGDVDPLNP